MANALAFPKTQYQRTFIRDWRKHRGLTLERLAERIPMANASLSRVERGLQPYSQPMLEAIAEALMCEPADLLMRRPNDDAIWSIWQSLKPESRNRALAVLRALQDTDKAA
jgi:transcriptional regulator with XRE-family HTH domain